jgi:O-antigen ligase
MLLPLALHYALYDRHRILVRRWWPVAMIAVALPIAISRSAIVGAIVVLAFVLPAWPVTVRRRAYGVIVLLGGALFVTVPGLLGTLTGLFTQIGTDSSAQSRTGSYTLAGEFISHAPVFGRGFLTFLPSYRILDNQYLGLIIDAGFVGLIALLGVFLTGIFTARRVYRKSSDERVRNLAQAVAASIAAIAVEFALFDAFSFPMAASMAFFVVGLAGALHRLAASRGTSTPTP